MADTNQKGMGCGTRLLRNAVGIGATVIAYGLVTMGHLEYQSNQVRQWTIGDINNNPDGYYAIFERAKSVSTGIDIGSLVLGAASLYIANRAPKKRNSDNQK